MKPKPAHKPAQKHHKKKMEPAVTRPQAHFRGRREGRREAWARTQVYHDPLRPQIIPDQSGAGNIRDQGMHDDYGCVWI